MLRQKHHLIAKIMHSLLSICLLLCSLDALAQSHAPSEATNQPDAPTFTEGQDYKILTEPKIDFYIERPTTLHPEPLIDMKVYYFFNYMSQSSYKIQPLLPQWIKKLPKFVKFSQSPTLLTADDYPLAKLSFIADLAEFSRHPRSEVALFELVRSKKYDLNNRENVAHMVAKASLMGILPPALISGNDIKLDRENGLHATYIVQQQQIYQNIRLNLIQTDFSGRLALATKHQEKFHIQRAGTFIIGGMYETNLSMAGGSPERLLEIVDYLIVKLKTEALEQAMTIHQQRQDLLKPPGMRSYEAMPNHPRLPGFE